MQTQTITDNNLFDISYDRILSEISSIRKYPDCIYKIPTNVQYKNLYSKINKNKNNKNDNDNNNNNNIIKKQKQLFYSILKSFILKYHKRDYTEQTEQTDIKPERKFNYDKYFKSLTNLIQASYDANNIYIDVYKAGDGMGIDTEIGYYNTNYYIPQQKPTIISNISYRDQINETPFYIARPPSLDETIIKIPIQCNIPFDYELKWFIYIVHKNPISNRMSYYEYIPPSPSYTSYPYQ